MTSKTLTGSHGRMVQLDGLRAFAFVLVTLHHGGLSIPWLDLGTAGVSIFFVLSGMLITGILLDNRQSCADGPFARLWVVRQFFLRRILRLSPLLCTVLCISVLVNLPPFRASWPWHFFYLSNIYQFIYGWDGYGSNLWTLAIEEQFYLFWPWVVLFMPPRVLVRILIAAMCLPVVVRYGLSGLVEIGQNRAGDPNLLLLAQLDSLAAGGLLACARRGLLWSTEQRLAVIISGWAATVWLVLTVFDRFGYLRESMQAFVWMYAVERCAAGTRSFSGRLLSASPVVYLGQISYGAYVLQGFVMGWWHWLLYQAPVPMYRIFARVGIAEQYYTSDMFQLIVWLAGTIGLAMLFWHMIELPVNRLKGHFPYRPSAGQ